MNFFEPYACIQLLAFPWSLSQWEVILSQEVGGCGIFFTNIVLGYKVNMYKVNSYNLVK